MIIKLLSNRLFTVDPALRFAKEYNVSPKIWDEIWKRHLFYEYDSDGICGYFTYKTGRRANARSLKRWLLRTEIYCRAQDVITKGARVVDSSYFGKFEQELLEELTKNMKYSGKQDSRTIV